MAGYDFDIGVLGGGAAGLTVTAGAARFGAKAILIEKEGRLGGDCLHYGCVPSKTLIKTAHVYHLMKNAHKFGLPPVELKPVDFREVSARIQSVIGVIQKVDSKERFCKLGAAVEFGEPVFTDEHTVALNGKRYSAKKWVIATGSSPARPYIEGFDMLECINSNDLFYIDELPPSMIVLGAGPIAIEMAQAFNRLGTEVTVVQRGPQILSKEDRDMADTIMHTMAAEGVKFHLNSTVKGVRKHSGLKELTIKSAAHGALTLRAKVLFVAMGRSVNVGGLGLEEIGLEFDSKGVKVDSRLRTNHKHIYAAGDVTGRYQFTHAAGYEGGVVLTNAIMRLPRKVSYTYLPWATYSDPELASVGMNEKRAKAAGIEYSVWTEEFAHNDRALTEGETTGKIKMLLDSREKPIGIQILGPHAGELISEWVAVTNGGVKLSTLASSVHPYPTLAEINKRVVGSFMSGKIFSDKVKKGLKFFFNLKGRACEPDELKED